MGVVWDKTYKMSWSGVEYDENKLSTCVRMPKICGGLVAPACCATPISRGRGRENVERFQYRNSLL